MSRTIIALTQPSPQSLVVRATLERAPVLYEYGEVEIDPAAVAGEDLVERGTVLGALLCAKDPLKTVLATAFSQPLTDGPAPLYFHVHSASVDAIPWEQLYLPAIGFCALDGRWPVGRIADRVTSVRGRPFVPPLRVVAVLSAAGRDPEPQLAALRQAVADLRVPTAGTAVPAHLHVISGDEDLVAKVTGPDETAELIAGTSPEVCQQIARADPHVVHLLCHGQKVAGVHRLTFASVGDADTPDRELGSINVTVADLVKALHSSDPWLMVLAACQTADAQDPHTRPFAHELVHQGLTAAIGMRRLVDLNATDRFCRRLYPDVVAAIRDAVAQPGREERVIDWAHVLTEARKVLSDPDPAKVDSWLDPVLYVQADDLRVRPESAATAAEHAPMQGRLDKFREVLLRPDLEPAFREFLVAEIQQMEARLGAGGRPVES